MRRRAVDQGQRHRRVGRVVERALALDDHPVAAPLALLDHPLDGALGEVADQPVDRDAPAVDHHPGLAGRHERRRAARRERRRPELEGDRHLADRAVGADGQDHPLARAVLPADRGLHPLRRPAVVDDPGARRPQPRRRTPGRRRGTCGARSGRRGRPGSPRGSSPATSPAACRRSGRCRSAACPAGSSRQVPRPARRRSGCRAPGRIDETLPPGLGRVDHGDDVVGPVADHADRGLAMVEAEVALGEDHDAAARWSDPVLVGVTRRSLRKRSLPRRRCSTHGVGCHMASVTPAPTGYGQRTQPTAERSARPSTASRAARPPSASMIQWSYVPAA